jgi:MATE family multidrug resistance protein
LDNSPTLRAEIGPTLKVAIPIMLGMLGYGLMFVVDVAMVGHLGETALAALALASKLDSIPYAFGIGAVGAIAVYQSQDKGAGVEESSPAILRHGMVLAVAIRVGAAIASHFAARFIPLLGSSPDMSAEAQEFFILMLWAMAPGLALRKHQGNPSTGSDLGLRIWADELTDPAQEKNP